MCQSEICASIVDFCENQKKVVEGFGMPFPENGQPKE